MGTAVKKSGRRRMLAPAGGMIRLAGLERDAAWNEALWLVPGEHPQVRHVQGGGGGIALAEAITRGEVVPAELDPRGLDGFLLVTPTHLGGVIVNGVGSEDQTHPIGVTIDGEFFALNTCMSRNHDDGSWKPGPPTPQPLQYFVANARTGRAEGPALVKRVFDVVERAVELYYQAYYRDFVLAELVQVNNFLLKWEQDNELMRSGKRGHKQAAERVYKLRFSGNIAAMKAHEQALLDHLQRHPAPAGTTDLPEESDESEDDGDEY